MKNEVKKQELDSLKSQVQTNKQRLDSLQREKQKLANQTSKIKDQSKLSKEESKAKQQQLLSLEGEILKHQTDINKLDNQIKELDEILHKYDLVQSFMNDIDDILNEYSSIEGVRIDQSTMMIKKLPQNELLNSNLPKEVCKKKCLDDFKEILLKMNDINAVDSEGKTLLMHTLMHGFDGAVELLLDNPELDCNIVDKTGQNALMYALGIVHIKITFKILDLTEDVNHKDVQGNTVLHYVVINSVIINSDEFLIMFPDKCKEENGTIHIDMSISDETFYYKNFFIAKKFIDYGLDINQKNNHGQTPFLFACIRKNKVIVKKLMEEGLVDYDIVDKSGIDVLSAILELRDISLLNKLFAERPNYDINHSDSSGKTGFFWMCQYGWLDMAKYLFDKGADANLACSGGATPFHIASAKKHGDIVNYLLDIGVQNVRDKNGLNNFLWGLEIPDTNLVGKMISKGYDINTQDAQGKTGLFWMCQYNWIEMVKYLLEKNADPNIPNKLGFYPIYIAIHRENLDVVKALIEHNANVNVETNNEKISPLYYAVACAKQKSNTETIEYLLKQNADPNSRMYDGDTPMHMAGYLSRIDLIKILLSFGGDLESVNDKGETPLYSCIKEETLNIRTEEKLAFVKFLIAKGANLNLETETSVVELASQYLPDAVTYLEHPETVPSIEEIEVELSGIC